MQLKSRHLLLFVVACGVLIYSDLAGGALIGLAAALQLALLVHGHEISRRSQLLAFKLFLISVPLLFFWGGVHSFVGIYLHEKQFLFFAMALIISAGLAALGALQLVFSFNFFTAGNFEVFNVLNESFNQIKSRRPEFFRAVLLLFIFSFAPWLTADWKLVFAVTATHLYLNRRQLKTAFARS